MKKRLLTYFLSFLFAHVSMGQTSIISAGSSWKYKDDGSNQGTAWYGTSFNDGSWSSGNAQLGYGDGDEATVVSYGSNASAKHITTYFRKSVTISDPSQFANFTLNVKRDDGIVVYVNGTEQYRNNLPSGTISYTTFAPNYCSDDGNTWFSATLASNVFTSGTNVIAVEIHQDRVISSDLSFDLELKANDVAPPTVNSYSPSDNTSGVNKAANLILTFNEGIQKGSGNILIKEGGTTTQTINVTSGSVTVSGSTLTIDPSNFTYGASVNIEMPAGVVKDQSNNNFAGISSATTWNFGVESAPDTIAPISTSYSPLDNATGVTRSSNLVITFNESIQKGSGNILIKEGGTTTETINVTSGSVTVSGSTLTIDPSDFTYGAFVNIEMPAGVVKDQSNNNFAGISSATTWNFGVESAPDTIAPTSTSYSPLDNATGVTRSSNLVITFNESIQKGSGNILIKEGGTTTQTINVISGSVTVSGSTLTIDPSDFTYGASVNIEMPSGIIKDQSNNNFAGISSATTWNFGVETAPDTIAPTATSYSPVDNAGNVAVNSNLVITFTENILRGNGNILIKEGGTTVQTIDVNSGTVSISGAVVTINPSDFANNASFNIEMGSGVFKDQANNNFSGISSAGTWNFTTVAMNQNVISAGSSWKYKDDGSNQGTAWYGTSFNDGSWSSGNAQLGYGDGDEATVVSYGSNASAKYITTYFRKTVTISNPSQFSNFTLNVKRDDGIVVYVNGTEQYRNNLPSGTISYTTLAPNYCSDDGNTWFSATLALNVFTSGTNVIAVEIHQDRVISSDLSFDLELKANDVAPPTVNSYSPSDNTSGVNKAANLILTFNEGIQKGSGNILIKEGGTTTQTINVTSGSVTVSGSTLTIDPSDFAYGASVNIEMPSGIVKDLSNNNFAGISSATTWNFGVESLNDTTAPLVNSYSPVDNATGVNKSSNLVLTFNESIQKGAGNILIKEGGITTQTISVTSGSVTVSGTMLTIDPANFNDSASVNIELGTGVVKDLSNNNFAGISSATTWNFGVESVSDTMAPIVSSLSPADNETGVGGTANLVINFNENIQKGSGNIIIKEGGITTQTISITSGSASVSGTTLTIDPADFTFGASVNIEIPSGLIKDMANNNFAGISGSGTWNFTINSENQTFISNGSAWKYLDNGSNQGTSWYGTSFNDASWTSGNGQFGYGDGDEATVVSYGPNATAKYITTYFRKSITISNPNQFTNFTLNVQRDDGIIVYINGVERYRNTMPTGTISYTTLASSGVEGDGTTWLTSTLASSAFTSGTNVVAVEIHQESAKSSDITFDMELVGNVSGNASLLRGPYLQMGTPNGIVIRWRSLSAASSKVNYGVNSTNLNLSVTDTNKVTDHVVQLTGLNPNTIYYYDIGSSAQILQGDADNYFRTAPVTGANQKTRIWVTGDCGNNSTNQNNVRKQYQSYIGSNITDVWLLLGDNAYNGGLDNEYQSGFYNIYKSKMLKQAVLWPSPGNHDYDNNAAKQNNHNIPYFDMFTLPTNAQAGGVASGTESYYSYNYANIHFISLDSYGKDSSAYRLYDTLGPQVRWLKKDLGSDTQKWRIVYWHHPPYTMGSNNSDSENDLIKIRQNLIKILERYKVDLILCGHSHDYERSKIMMGHFGNESSFNASTHQLSSSSAKYDGTSNSCPYHKSQSNGYKGTVYVVAGSAGQLGNTQAAFPHNAMFFSDATNAGSLAIEVLENRLDAKWICADGNIRDKFTILKDVSKTVNMTISPSQNTLLKASWVGNYSWNTGGKTSRSVLVSPSGDTTYSVTDSLGCITDIFNITVDSTLHKRSPVKRSSTLKTASSPDNLEMKIYPNPFTNQTVIEYQTPYSSLVIIEVYNMSGIKVKSVSGISPETGSHKIVLNAGDSNLAEGLYIVKLKFEESQILQKIRVTKE